MRWLVVLVFVGGCYSPPKPCGAQCAVEGDGGGLDTTSGDTDGDGIPNATDHCPMVFDPNNYDHDMDGTGDVCDPCPHISGIADGDGDGVGDACDTRPTIAGETRLRFYGFYTANETAWDATQNWTFADGRASAHTTQLDQSFTLFAPLGQGVRDIEIRAGISVREISTSSGVVSSAGVAIRHTTSGEHRCILQYQDMGNTQQVIYRDGQDAAVAWAGNTIAMHQFRQAAVGTNGACRISGVGPNRSGLTNPAVATSFGIAGHAAYVEVDYIFAVGAVAVE